MPIYTPHMATRPVMAVAHRGASAYAPENTVAALDEAVRLHARAIEFDLRVTPDGEMVVIHIFIGSQREKLIPHLNFFEFCFSSFFPNKPIHC